MLPNFGMLVFCLTSKSYIIKIILLFVPFSFGIPEIFIFLSVKVEVVVIMFSLPEWCEVSNVNLRYDISRNKWQIIKFRIG